MATSKGRARVLQMAKRKAKRSKSPKKSTARKRAKAKARKSKSRDRGLNPGLKKGKFSRIKQEYFDQDYIDQLNDKEKAWLSKFNDEWLGANTKDAKFHKSKKAKKRCNDQNNARNRDIYSQARALGRLQYAGDTTLKEENTAEYEDELIDYIDSKKD